MKSLRCWIIIFALLAGIPIAAQTTTTTTTTKKPAKKSAKKKKKSITEILAPVLAPVVPELTDDKIVAGLKEALQVGTDNAVKLTGKEDGYFGNPDIKIPLPKNMQKLENGLRIAGFAPKIDEFILSMNRAAEQAAPEARKIFVDAILAMTFEDARKLLKGGDTSITEYFQDKTTPALTAAFTPIVEDALQKHEVTRKYDALTGKARTIPFLKAQTVDIKEYVVTQALNGLFFMLSEEERKIRKDPAAQVTSLLKEVFGKH